MDILQFKKCKLNIKYFSNVTNYQQYFRHTAQGQGQAVAPTIIIIFPYNSKDLRYSRNSPPKSFLFKANSTVAIKKPSLSPASWP